MKNKTFLNFIRNLSLDKKLAAAITTCVILSIAVITILIVRRETILLEEDNKKNAEVLSASISIALKDNMLGGRPEETVRLIKELSAMKGVEGIIVLNPDGRPAFGMQAPALELKEDLRDSILKGNEAEFSTAESQYFIKPLLNEKQCRSCHFDNKQIRGAVIVRLSTSGISGNIIDLVERMTGFGIVASVVLSVLLIFLTRRLLISPIKGLTEAARQIALGNFTLFNQRGTHCYEILDCKKTECPSHKFDDAIPCWLESGTLCEGKVTGDFALKLGDCYKCRVYKELKGDELRQLIDKFNKMSLTMQKHENDIKNHINNVEYVNQELRKSNTKLNTLLEASRITTSTLKLDEILSASLKIILNVTNLKAGIILLLEEDLEKKCYEFFDCDAFNCPAYKAALNCWRLAGTMCHSGDASACPFGSTAISCWKSRHIHSHYTAARNFDEKVNGCSNCEFFANIVLIPKMIAGFQNGSHIGKKLRLDSTTIQKALLMGRTMVDYSRENPFNLPIDTVTELAVPLKMQDEMIGILYLASDESLHYDKNEIEFFQLLSEVISAGILNSRIYYDMETSYLQTVMALANAIEAKDPYTKGHTERVASLSNKIAGFFKLSEQEKEHLNFASLLHDIGKIGISKDILWKHCSLDECEEEEVKTHPDKGVQILEPVHFLKPILSTIRHHHEKYDGSGYPLGLKGKEIPFKARIISIADTWDAMLSDRPYRRALTTEEAKNELKKHSGIQFDPEIVVAFIKVLESEGQ
ncbi:MAG: HD domain-containing protein [Nitrospiraceae bacterium]|nr:MAG: HD domain-containing protein [Nitrospiraceae bacterium]